MCSPCSASSLHLRLSRAATRPLCHTRRPVPACEAHVCRVLPAPLLLASAACYGAVPARILWLLLQQLAAAVVPPKRGNKMQQEIHAIDSFRYLAKHTNHYGTSPRLRSHTPPATAHTPPLSRDTAVITTQHLSQRVQGAPALTRRPASRDLLLPLSHPATPPALPATTTAARHPQPPEMMHLISPLPHSPGCARRSAIVPLQPPPLQQLHSSLI